MRRYSEFLAVAMAAAALATSCTAGKGWTLDCSVPEGWQGKQVVLYTEDTGDPVAIDSTLVRNGAFSFKGSFSSPRLCKAVVYLNPEERHNRQMTPTLEVFLDSTAVVAEASKEKSGMKFNTVGGDSMEEWKRYEEGKEPFQRERKAAFNRYIDVFYVKEMEKEGIAAALAVTANADALQQYRKDHVAGHPASMVSLRVLHEFVDAGRNMTDQELEAVCRLMDPEVLDTPQGKALLERIAARKVEVGAPCPEAVVQDRDGGKHLLPELLVPGHYTLVELWASWCSPCRGEIPFIRRAWNKYRSKGLDIISISVNNDLRDWLEALGQEKMPWTQMVDVSGKVMEVFETQSVPTSLIIGPDGKIFRMDTRGGWLDATLEEIYE